MTARETEGSAGRALGRVAAASVSCAAVAGIVIEALPSVLRAADPADSSICPAIWPPSTFCMPGTHLVVTAVSLLVLVSVWMVGDLALRRSGDRVVHSVVIVGVTLVALAAWYAARVPQLYVVAWSLLFG